ncbi:MAG: hypothetical protein J0H44_15335 [Alphaproteobacteria bacterium]|nr:hypothetical protein [Alphaproteobacteria bacterium]
MLYELKAARLEPLQPARMGRRAGVFSHFFTHIGSSIALVLGFFGLLGELSAVSKGLEPSGMIVGAPIMILGAIAYRSAKKRALGEASSTLARWMFEISSLVLILALLLAQPHLKELMATDPAPYFVIPLWALTAWLIAATQALVRNHD